MISRALLLVVALGAHAAELPKFADYPAPFTKVEPYAKAIIPDVHDVSRCIRDLRYDRPEAPNFADRFTLFLTGCGTGCAEFCLIDRVTGRVSPGFLSIGGPKLEFARNSRLVIIKHTDGMYGDSNPFFADCYAWEKDHFRFLGRWVTTYGLAQQEMSIDWTAAVTLNPNPPTWHTE